MKGREIGMGRKRRILSFVVCAAMSVALLTGCGNGQGTVQSEALQESAQGKEESKLPKAEKIKIVVRALECDERIKECIALFNEQSGMYVVQLDIVTGSAYRFQETTYEDLVNGQGADIFTVDSLYDVYSLANTGVVADLKPYMEASGIRAEDYFPFAFDGWREENKIYGVNVMIQPEGCWIDADFLNEEPYTLEAVLTNMQNSPKSVFRQYSSWEKDLVYCLSGSDNLWGMIDEENGTCDLQGMLLQQLMETFYNHSFYGGGTNYQIVAGDLMDTYWYKFVSEEELKEEGKIRIGYFGNDNCHTLSSQDNMFLINANSPNVEGAWEFLEFMLSEQVQSLMLYDRYPVSRTVFEKLMTHEMEEGSVMDGEEVVLKAGNQRYYEANGTEAYRALYDLTEEKVAEIRNVVENTKATSLKTVAIINIIAEEYNKYSSDDTTIEELITLLETKVKLYLDTYK